MNWLTFNLVFQALYEFEEIPLTDGRVAIRETYFRELGGDGFAAESKAEALESLFQCLWRLSQEYTYTETKLKPDQFPNFISEAEIERLKVKQTKRRQ